MKPQTPFQTGLDVCLREPPIELSRAAFGLLANQASTDGKFVYAWDLLAARFPGRLRALFSPQHGLWGEQQANMIETPDAFDERSGLPIYSLYSEIRRPSAEQLAGLDALVVDLQDVGTRVYTFVWTISYCLEACAELGIPVWILDRPNPLGGIVEGPRLDVDYTSFVGRASIPMRHGLTLAELTRFVNAGLRIGADVRVVPMRGWTRTMRFPASARPWIPPSPNLPTLESVALYPGQVLLEGTNLSEGRGTTTPFEVVGAPFIDPERLREEAARFSLPGVAFRPVRFRPTFDKWADQSCGGVFIHVTDPKTFRPYRTTVALLHCVRRLWPTEFRWIEPPYEYETERMPIDILTGSSALREFFDGYNEISDSDLDRLADLGEDDWNEQTAPYRLSDYG